MAQVRPGRERGAALSEGRGGGSARARRGVGRSATLLLLVAGLGGAVPATAAGPLVQAGILAGACALLQAPSPPPAGLTAAAVAATRAQLTWVGPGENGSFTTIWRKSFLGGSDFVRIGTAPAGDTGYTDETTDPNTRYLYRVRAETPEGSSGWSNEVPITTPAPPAGVAVQAAVPSEAIAADTPVLLSYTLPDGYQLDRNPYFVVVDPSGGLFELLPAYLTQPSPQGQGYRDLHTELYPAGAYQIRAQLSLLDASARPGGAASPWMPLTVPPPAVASLAVGPTLAARQSIPGMVRLAGGSRNQPAVVTLSCSNPAAAAVPASVSIPPWSVEATFTVTAGAVTLPTPVTITAAYNGSSLSAPLTVTPAAQARGTGSGRRGAAPSGREEVIELPAPSGPPNQ